MPLILTKVKEKYAAQRQEGIAREEGPIGGKILVGEEVLVKEEDTAARKVF